MIPEGFPDLLALLKRSADLESRIFFLAAEQLAAPTLERLQQLDALQAEADEVMRQLRGVETSTWRAMPCRGQSRLQFRLERRGPQLMISFRLGRDGVWRPMPAMPITAPLPAPFTGTPIPELDLEAMAAAVEADVQLGPMAGWVREAADG